MEEKITAPAVPVLQPVWEKQVAIAMSSSQLYAPYLCVCLQSLKEHAAADCNYDIVIFTSEIDDETKRIIAEHIACENISVRYVNPKPYFANIKLHISHYYFKEECYYRLVAPWIFRQYERVIFTDMDLLFEHDIQPLYHTDLHGKPIAACIDMLWHGIINHKPSLRTEYAMKTLGMKDAYKYVNTGVVVMDIARCLEMNFTEKTLELVNTHKYETQEQCAINALLQENIQYLDFSWNVSNQAPWIKATMKFMPPETLQHFTEANAHPKILHFMGSTKPWLKPTDDSAWLWWSYAQRTPFYEQLLQRVFGGQIYKLQEQIRGVWYYPWKKIKYLYMRLLSNLTWGQKRTQYEQKRKQLKTELESKKVLWS